MLLLNLLTDRRSQRKKLPILILIFISTQTPQKTNFRKQTSNFASAKDSFQSKLLIHFLNLSLLY